MSDDKEMSANTGIEIALAVLHQAIDGGSVNTHPERMLKAVVALTPFRAHLATETAAIQKVRDEIKRNSECLWARHKDTTHCDAERALAFGQYDNSVWWLAALDVILEGRKK